MGREALVSHVTELAADFEATNLYVRELLRHVNDPGFVEGEERTEVLSGLIYLAVAGAECNTVIELTQEHHIA